MVGLREYIQETIRKEIKYHQLIREGMLNWLIDKAGAFAQSLINSKTDYSLARITKDPAFRKLHKQFNMTEEEFVEYAERMIKENPKRFADILAYDSRKSRWF